MIPVVELKAAPIDQRLVASVIYKQEPHRVTDAGMWISAEAAQELSAFAQSYAAYLGVDPVFRIDMYIEPAGGLAILEVNTAFVDGWGTALNLTRAIGVPVDPALLSFPACLSYESEAYLPELKVLRAELAALGLINHHICPLPTACRPTYVYGRASGPGILPGAVEQDNKLNLARFARQWRGELVRIPKTYTFEDTAWDDIPPRDVFLKFTVKGGEPSDRAGFSVKLGKPTGKSRFLRRCFAAGELIAQERVETVRCELAGFHHSAQIVLLTNGRMFTGYVQYDWHGLIINDNSIHGPLVTSG